MEKEKILNLALTIVLVWLTVELVILTDDIKQLTKQSEITAEANKDLSEKMVNITLVYAEAEKSFREKMLDIQTPKISMSAYYSEYEEPGWFLTLFCNISSSCSYPADIWGKINDSKNYTKTSFLVRNEGKRANNVVFTVTSPRGIQFAVFRDLGNAQIVEIAPYQVKVRVPVIDTVNTGFWSVFYEKPENSTSLEFMVDYASDEISGQTVVSGEPPLFDFMP